MDARIINVVWGVWLFISAFVWPHSTPQAVNAWVCGLLVVTFALLGMRSLSKIHYANTAVGIWLVVSSFLLPVVSSGTRWNHVAVGLLIALASIIPNFPAVRYGPPRPGTPP